MRRFTLFPAALLALGVAGMGLAAGVDAASPTLDTIKQRA